MGIGLRQVRVGNEWKLLQQLASLNQSVIDILGRRSVAEEDLFCIALRQTCGIAQAGAMTKFVLSHRVEIRLARFFPSVPIDARLVTPVFHPNVDPGTGFVCLWNRFSPGDTVSEVLYRLQHIISWTWVNLDGVHVVQLDAAKWYQDPLRRTALPLTFTPLRWPAQLSPGHQGDEKPRARSRRRLESVVVGSETA